MNIIGQFARLLSDFTRLLQAPMGMFKTLSYRFTSPFKAIKASFTRLKMLRPSRFLRVPPAFRQLQAVIENFARQFPFTKKLLEKRKQEQQEREVAEIADIEGSAFHLERRKAEYSQVHLVHERSKKRNIGHIGTDTGRSETEFQLGADTNLAFLRVNAKIYNAPLLLQAQSKQKVFVDGEELGADGQDSLPVRGGSVIKIGANQWHVELFAWDELPPLTRVRAAWATHIGPLHDHNEDAIGIYQHAAAYLFAVADGVGGTSVGEIASEFTIQYLISVVDENLKYGFDWHEVLHDAITVINHTIRKKTELSGIVSSAVLTAVVIQNWDVFVMHIGDTRLYHYGKDGLHQVTRDHMVMIEQAGLNPGEVILHPVLARAIGKEDTIHPDLMLLRLHPGDRLLLVSDGVGTVEEAQLAELMRHEAIDDLPDKLMSLAYQQGSNDNVSIIAIEALNKEATFDQWQASASSRVYVDAQQELEFDTEDVLQTSYPMTSSGVFAWLLFIFLLCSFSVMSWDWFTRPEEIIPTATPHATRVFAVTQPPTSTPIIVETPIPSVTPLPPQPTSTLRPVPTSTLDAPVGSGKAQFPAMLRYIYMQES